MEKKETIVLYPSMGAGHIAPMVPLAKRFIEHGFSVAIVTSDSPHNHGATSGGAISSSLMAANPSISFHALPKPISLTPPKNGDPFSFMYDIIRENNPKLLAFLTSLSTTTTIRAVVLDFFVTDAIDIARQLDIPVYVFFASGASVLAMVLNLSVLDTYNEKSFKDMGDVKIDFPGVPPLPASDMPGTLKDRESEIYKRRTRNYKQFLDADGILVNSFESLEPKAVKVLKEGKCVPGHRMPPVYCIGPLITENLQYEKHERRHECLIWLDSQPKSSVIFLCFGSSGAFTSEQIEKIAIGLENSGQRFLWAVRWKENPQEFSVPRSEPDLDSLLPEGFVNRTKERGMVLKSWAPQVDVLNHESIGGFVTHCGWNSTLETILAGVPMICWPLYAEQSMNKVLLVEEIKVGVVMEGYNEGLVRAEEVAVKLRWLMESEGGRKLRERVAAVKEKAGEALAEEGDFVAFLRDLHEMRSKIGRAEC